MRDYPKCKCGASILLISPKWFNSLKKPTWCCASKSCQINVPELTPWVVSAANRHKKTRFIVTGARHFDNIMRSQIKAYFKSLNEPENWGSAWEQGFIDQFGNFLTRKEAMVIAKENGQIRRDGERVRLELFSENLY